MSQCAEPKTGERKDGAATGVEAICFVPSPCIVSFQIVTVTPSRRRKAKPGANDAAEDAVLTALLDEKRQAIAECEDPCSF